MEERLSKRYLQFERLFEVVSWALAAGLVLFAWRSDVVPPQLRPRLALVAVLIGVAALCFARLMPIERLEGVFRYEAEDKALVESLTTILLIAAFLYLVAVPVPGMMFLFLVPIMTETLVLHERVIAAEAAFASIAVIFLRLADPSSVFLDQRFIIESSVFLFAVLIVIYLTRRLRLLMTRNEALSEDLSARLDQIQVVSALVGQTEFFAQVDKLMRRIGEIVSDAFDAERCAVFVSGSDERLEFQAPGVGFREQELAAMSLSENVAIIERCIENGRPGVLPSEDLVAVKRMKNVMVCPLTVGKRRVGALLVADRRGGGEFSDLDLNFLHLLAGFVSTLIDSANAFSKVAEERRTAERMTKLLVGREMKMRELKSRLAGNGNGA